MPAYAPRPRVGLLENDRLDHAASRLDNRIRRGAYAVVIIDGEYYAFRNFFCASLSNLRS